MTDSSGESSQQPTADCAAITDTLVNEIMELLTEMNVRGMDVSCERLVFQNLIRSMPTQSPEVSAGRLQKFMTTLRSSRNRQAEAELRNHRAAEAELAPDKPDGSSTSIAIGRKASPATRTHGDCDQMVQISNGAAGAADVQMSGDEQGDAATDATRLHSMRPETLAKCEALREFALAFMREQLAHDNNDGNARGGQGIALLQSISVQKVCTAYAASRPSPQSEEEDWNHWRWIFTMKYLDMDALRRAVATNDDSIGRVGEGKIKYTTIEAAILDSKGGKAHRYRTAADWCAAKLKGEEFQILSKGKKLELLLKKWAEECPVQDCSLKSLFNNGPFSMNKILDYKGDAGPAAGGDAASGRQCPAFDPRQSDQ